MRAVALLLLLGVVAVMGQAPAAPAVAAPVVAAPVAAAAAPVPVVISPLAMSILSMSAPNEELAIMTKPAATLKKPIIFSPIPAAELAADEPLVGPLPATQALKPAAVSENIFGGAVEFENATTPYGCPCQRIAAEKHRYDTEFKEEVPVPVVGPCGCNATALNVTDPAALLPPIVARLYREPVNITALLAPCNATLLNTTVVEKIAPQYYNNDRTRPVAQAGVLTAEQAAKTATVATVAPVEPCPNPALNTTVVQNRPVYHFYGETPEERAARRAARRERQAVRDSLRAARESAHIGLY